MFRSRWIPLATISIATALATCGFAEEAEVVETESIVSLLAKGGVIGWVIIGLSVVAVALMIDFFVNLKREKLVPTDLINELEALFDEQNFEGANDLCDQEDTVLTNVVGAALPQMEAGWEHMAQAAKNRSEEEAIKMHQKIGWLAVAGNVGPLLGLLGTVWGMVQAFARIAQTGNPTPQDLAGGIYTALITTVLGICVAIPCSVMFYFFRNRVVRATLDVDAITASLLERFRPQG